MTDAAIGERIVILRREPPMTTRISVAHGKLISQNGFANRSHEPVFVRPGDIILVR